MQSEQGVMSSSGSELLLSLSLLPCRCPPGHLCAAFTSTTTLVGVAAKDTGDGLNCRVAATWQLPCMDDRLFDFKWVHVDVDSNEDDNHCMDRYGGGCDSVVNGQEDGGLGKPKERGGLSLISAKNESTISLLVDGGGRRHQWRGWLALGWMAKCISRVAGVGGGGKHRGGKWESLVVI